MDNKSVLLEVLKAALDHHDPEQPEVTHDLPALATKASGGSAVLKDLFLGIISDPAILSVVAAWVMSKLGHSDKPVESVHNPATQVHDVETGTVVPVAPAAPKPVALQMPDEVGLDVSQVFGPNRNGRLQRTPFEAKEIVDGAYQLVMGDGTASLDDGSGLYLAGILMLGGQKVKVEQVPGAKDRLYWKCTHVESGDVNLLTSEGASGNGRASNWREDEFTRTGGFDVVLHVAKAGTYLITFGVLDTPLEAVPIRTPEVR